MVGLKNLTWVTAPGEYLLPFRVGTGRNDPNGTYSILSRFSFVVTANIGHMAACWSTLLRSDYNSTLEQITSTNAHPEAVVLVCPWW